MQRIILCFISALLISPSAFAGDWYFGGKVGSMLVDLPESSDPQNGGIVVGWEQGIVLGDIGVEADFTRTLSDGELGNDDLSIDTVGVYGVYRTPGAIYFKAKVGAVREDATRTQGDFSSSSDDTGSSVGLGIGFSAKLVKFELEFTSIEEDADYLSLSILF